MSVAAGLASTLPEGWSASSSAGREISTGGASLTIKAKRGKVTADKVYVTKTDISADNGVIHVIDTVLMPKK